MNHYCHVMKKMLKVCENLVNISEEALDTEELVKDTEEEKVDKFLQEVIENNENIELEIQDDIKEESIDILNNEPLSFVAALED